tara:strand:+ start:242 stop:424 length:183 start_codon:yes stop_codon:yes gene_type:complete
MVQMWIPELSLRRKYKVFVFVEEVDVEYIKEGTSTVVRADTADELVAEDDLVAEAEAEEP